MKVSDFDYELPDELIAQHAAEPRDSARLMVLHRADGRIEHRRFRDLPEYLGDGDVLVLNNTRVMPWRITAERKTGGQIEGLLIEKGPDTWQAMLKGRGRLKVGERLTFLGGPLEGELVEKEPEGTWRIRFLSDDAEALIEQFGRAPLPPYIVRKGTDAARDAHDRERYQTTFARVPGAIAAPTAGMHFTTALLEKLRGSGVEIVTVTLAVGVGTFAPVRTEAVEEHQMHTEAYEISRESAERINRARAEGRRLVAVGTTSVRVIEHGLRNGLMQAEQGSTNLFITPGYAFRGVGALVTNFHLPKSTLLMLVSAFAGREKILEAYRVAVREGYRFYSYGDGMLIL